MTDAKGTRRRRRSSGADGLPRDLVAWFAGEPRRPDQTATPWSALVFPDYPLVAQRWLAWKSDHPTAKPPVGWEWLDDPASPQHPPAWLVTLARACANRKTFRRR